MTPNIQSNNLVDIRTVKVDKNLQKQERIIEYVRQIGDPYHFKYKDIDITAHYPKNGPPMENCLKQSAT